jgi:regulator of extracellular matrix RemA (YlzA/DUF370 family)
MNRNFAHCHRLAIVEPVGYSIKRLENDAKENSKQADNNIAGGWLNPWRIKTR